MYQWSGGLAAISMLTAPGYKWRLRGKQFRPPRPASCQITNRIGSCGERVVKPGRRSVCISETISTLPAYPQDTEWRVQSSSFQVQRSTSLPLRRSDVKTPRCGHVQAQNEYRFVNVRKSNGADGLSCNRRTSIVIVKETFRISRSACILPRRS